MSANQAVILCIDDDRDTLILLERLLTDAGHKVVTATDGKQGLVEASTSRPNLILLDVMMPGLDGFAVCSQLQENPETAYVPVVFLTALDGEADRAKAFAVGASEYLAKPIHKDVLLATVGEQLKTGCRWQELKGKTVSWDGTAHPEHFTRFKQSLVERLGLSKEAREKLEATAPADLYKLCDQLGITQGRMTSWIADFLSLPLLPRIDPTTLLPGVIPATFARENRVVVTGADTFSKSFVICNPFDWILLDTLSSFFNMRRETPLSLAEPDHIDALFERPDDAPVKVSGVRLGHSWEIPAETVGKMSPDEVEKHPIVAITNNILRSAVSERASDIHVEPKMLDTLVRFRIDGDMRDVYTLKKETGVRLISSFKAVAGLDISERKKPQDGAVEAVISGRTFKLRLATTSTPSGESLIVRLLEPEVKAKDLRTLGMTDEQVRTMVDFANRSQGLVLIVGPTGSGKTTTIYSLLSHIDCRTRSLISVEDPVEYRIPFANQQQVDEKRGVTFDAVLKSSVRQDPDILFLGEVRDPYSARVAMDFASTGHLTISTLHTSNATTALFRLERLGVTRGMMADSVLGIVAQRLLKKLCPRCRVVRPTTSEERELMSPFTTNVPTETAHPVGCQECNQTGYFGREAVYEIIRFDAEVIRTVRSGESIAGIRALIRRRGDYLIGHHAVEKVRALSTSITDVNENVLLEEAGTGWDEQAPEKAAKAKAPAGAQATDGKPKAVLVVEDDEDTKNLIGRILENASYDVTLATDGIDALMSIGQKSFDLIISDIAMPNLDGFRLVEMIHQKGIVTPVMFLTASTDEQDEGRGMDLGAVDFIKKPIQKEQLLSRVRNVLNNG